MKVLIGNFHNGNFGGGEFYTYQVAKAISGFAEILFCQEPNRNIWVSNPFLKISYRLWNGVEKVDAFINLNHFNTLICNTATKNYLGVFFPNKSHKVADYNDIVVLCPFAGKYVKEFWGRDSKICAPYSKQYAPGAKVKNTIVSIGNFFKESDGHSKNQHVLIDAFRKLGNGWSLTLLGNEIDPKYVSQIRNQAEGLNVDIIPNAPESVKDKTLLSSEFYWHANGFGRTDPYQTEHFGIAPEEALKAGCLTYVHASGGAQDFCSSWETVKDLVRMTRERAPNKQGVKFQTPQQMQEFWKTLLNASN